MIPFAGFEMPIQYDSIKLECLAVRNSCGIFDVGHMGEFLVTGKEAVNFVDYLISNDFSSPAFGKAVYSPICRENGTIIDDLIAYKIKSEKILLCVNASNIKKDWDWINSHINNFECEIEDISDLTSLVAIQGPKSEEYLKNLNILDKSQNISSFSVIEKKIDEKNIIIARTGYTGEDGFELFCPNLAIKNIWSELVNIGAKPCGLAARDVLRTEACFPLYGNELIDTITPLDAGLKWTVKLSKGQFLGKKTLLDYLPRFQLVKLVCEKGIPRSNYEVYNNEKQLVGSVTSGTMSVSIQKGIALARIEKLLMPQDKIFYIKIRNKLVEAKLSAKSFVSGGSKQ